MNIEAEASTAATGNRFGGAWTEEKLVLLQKYLGFYTQALKGQNFDLVYIDTFAGTGRGHIRSDAGDRVIDGSAKIALDCSPPFSRYHFIEKKKSHAGRSRRGSSMPAEGQGGHRKASTVYLYSIKTAEPCSQVGDQDEHLMRCACAQPSYTLLSNLTKLTADTVGHLCWFGKQTLPLPLILFIGGPF